MFAAGAPARLVAIFDWEMATIGDPLADVGYMLMQWTQAGDRVGKFNLNNVTLRPGFPTRAELTARYEERSGRSVQALDWYVDAGAVEGGRVHGGQLQARVGRVHRRPVPEARSGTA